MSDETQMTKEDERPANRANRPEYQATGGNFLFGYSGQFAGFAGREIFAETKSRRPLNGTGGFKVSRRDLS